MQQTPQRRTVGRPKDPQKRAALLDAAKRLFIGQGYGQTSIEEVAQAAGVAKLTVYSHFEGKEHLFAEVIIAKCDEHFGGRDLIRFADRPPAPALTEIGRRFLELLLSPDVIALHRMMLGCAQSSPALCQRFWDAGPGPVLASLAELLRHYRAGGQLEIPDVHRAADHFLALLHGKLHLRACLGLGPAPTRRELAALVRSAVALFLRAHRPRSEEPGSGGPTPSGGNRPPGKRPKAPAQRARVAPDSPAARRSHQPLAHRSQARPSR